MPTWSSLLWHANLPGGRLRREPGAMDKCWYGCHRYRAGAARIRRGRAGCARLGRKVAARQPLEPLLQIATGLCTDVTMVRYRWELAADMRRDLGRYRLDRRIGAPEPT